MPAHCHAAVHFRCADGTTLTNWHNCETTNCMQVEGAWNDSGRTPSVWDAFAHVEGTPNADVAADHYHHYKQDIKMMKDLGVRHYRWVAVGWRL